MIPADIYGVIFKAGNYMYMKMEYCLARGFTVVLKDIYSVAACNLLYGGSYLSRYLEGLTDSIRIKRKYIACVLLR